MKKIVKLCLVLGILCTMLLSSTTVYATSILNEIMEGESDEIYSEDTEYNLLRGSHLSYGNARLTKLSANSISVYGLTQCHHFCDNVYLSLYLERKVNGSYGTYKYWTYNTTDASSLSKSLVVSVPSGYYYRIRGYHAASDAGSSKESTSTLTDGIYVG